MFFVVGLLVVRNCRAWTGKGYLVPGLLIQDSTAVSSGTRVEEVLVPGRLHKITGRYIVKTVHRHVHTVQSDKAPICIHACKCTPLYTCTHRDMRSQSCNYAIMRNPAH